MTMLSIKKDRSPEQVKRLQKVKNEMNSDNKTRLNFIVDKNLLLRFKLCCIDKNLSMSDILKRMLINFLEKNETPKPPSDT